MTHMEDRSKPIFTKVKKIKIPIIKQIQREDSLNQQRESSNFLKKILKTKNKRPRINCSQKRMMTRKILKSQINQTKATVARKIWITKVLIIAKKRRIKKFKWQLVKLTSP